MQKIAPIIDNIAKTKLAYEQVARDFAKRNEAPGSEVLRMLNKFVSLVKGKNVLDIGCANGRDVKYLSERGFSARGCDLSEELIKIAKNTCPDCEFFVADMRDPPKGNKYNGLWVSASFLHIPKTEAKKTLRGFNKILEAGGVMYISVMEGEFNGLRENINLGIPERHFSDYGEQEMKILLAAAGFTVVDFERTKANWGRTFLNYFCTK